MKSGTKKYPSFLTASALLLCLSHNTNSHSWVVDVGHDGGRSRGGVDGSDHLRQKYFCPSQNLTACQPDPKHGITLNEGHLRPCRPHQQSQPMATVTAGTDLHISWMGNGHVDNGQSDGTCVRLMIAPSHPDPDFSDFRELPGGGCLPYWHPNSLSVPTTDADIEIPLQTTRGTHVLLWYWDFTDFWFSSCADIVVTDSPTRSPLGAPTQSPIFAASSHPSVETESPLAEIYVREGCTDARLPEGFCGVYVDPKSYCKSYATDECGRSTCQGADFLLPCSVPSPPPSLGVHVYRQQGCAELNTSFCTNHRAAGSYCKNYQSDSCGRSICQGDGFEFLLPCGVDQE